MAPNPQTPPSRFQAAQVGMCLETLLAHRSLNDPADFVRVAEATAAAGFPTVSMSGGRAAEVGIERARRILDDTGVQVKLVELVTYWAKGPDAALNGFEQQLDTIEALGATRILAVAQQTEMDMARATEGFASLCERAAQRNVQVAIEFVPNRALCDLATAWQVVAQSGAPNGGIDLDMKHWQNQPNGPDLDLLRSIPGQHVLYVQVCDAFSRDSGVPQYLPAAIADRPLPGDGVVDIPGILEALSDIGAEPFFAAEVFNAGLAARGPESMAARIREAVAIYFEQVDGAAPRGG
jgi:sugar phosphate isomerase/epimerase